MSRTPPKVVEIVVQLLLPPACREHVLGDLHERYVSVGRYLWDVVTTVPLVVLSRIRRTTNFRLLPMEAAALYASFLAAGRFAEAFLVSDDNGVLRPVLPAVVALLVLVLRDAYAAERHLSPLRVVHHALTAVTCAVLSQSVLSFVQPEMTMPAWPLLVGAGTGLLLVSVLRVLFASTADDSAITITKGEPTVNSPEDVRRKVQELDDKARGWSVTMSAVLILAIVLGGITLTTGHWGIRLAGGVALAGALYAAGRIYLQFYRRLDGRKPTGAEASVDLYRRELQRRRDAMRTLWLWYAGPVLVALNAFAARLTLAHPDPSAPWLRIAPFVALSLVWAVLLAALARRIARELQTEIDAVGDREERA